MDMICFMHEGSPYGHLKVGDKVILPFNLSRMVGETLDVVEGWLDELSTAGVYEITDEGVIYSKRMIRDENLRQVRAAGGSKGGNPALMDKSKVNLEVKQKTTPSSSSSSSSSNINIEPTVLVPTAKAERTPSAPISEIVELFNAKLPQLPRCEVLNESRKRTISARWREVVAEQKFDRQQGLDWFGQFFDHVRGSKFLTGKVKDWKADIDFIFTPSKFARIVEGAYHKD
jgi:hypothetical protein